MQIKVIIAISPITFHNIIDVHCNQDYIFSLYTDSSRLSMKIKSEDLYIERNIMWTWVYQGDYKLTLNADGGFASVENPHLMYAVGRRSPGKLIQLLDKRYHGLYATMCNETFEIRYGLYLHNLDHTNAVEEMGIDLSNLSVQDKLEIKLRFGVLCKY